MAVKDINTLPSSDVADAFFGSSSMAAKKIPVNKVADIINALSIDHAGLQTITEAQKQALRDALGIGTVLSNPNLLDNSHFLVNQRNASGTFTATNTEHYGIDRWRVPAGCTETINSDGTVTFANTTSGILYIEHMVLDEYPKTGIAGKKVTISAVKSDGTILKATSANACPAAQDSSNHNLVSTAEGVPAIRLYLLNSSSAHSLTFQIQLPAGSSITLRACKLEVGEVSTILTDSTTYGEELSRCQRYYYAGAAMVHGFLTSSGTQYYSSINLPVPMVKIPTVSFTQVMMRFYNGYSRRSPDGSTYGAPGTLYVSGMNGSTISLRDTITNAGDPNNSIYVAQLNGLVVSCEP